MLKCGFGSYNSRAFPSDFDDSPPRRPEVLSASPTLVIFLSLISILASLDISQQSEMFVF